MKVTRRLRNTKAVRYSKERPFVDRVKVLLASGAGGDGASIMGSLMNNEFAGPMGGNGGKGGDMFVKSSKSVQDLDHIAQMGSQIVAGKGSIGFNQLSSGRRGQSVELVVPLGTQIVDIDSNQVVVDLDQTDMKVLLLEGGQGGKGNANFASAVVHSPKEATRGMPGNTMLANIELKLIADCGLVGYPNAGKSSLLNAISTSRPRIANYPFTTLHPFVGQVHNLYGQSCSVADLPGLIEGAFENRGMGHEFLRHIERTTAIAFVIDMYSPFVPTDTSISSAMASIASAEASLYKPSYPDDEYGDEEEEAGSCGHSHEHGKGCTASGGSGGNMVSKKAESFAEYAAKNPDQFTTSSSSGGASSSSSPSSDPFAIHTATVRMQEPWEVLETLQNELEFYMPGLSDKSLIVFANKMDLAKDSAGNCMQAKLEEFRRRTHLPIYPVSAARGIEMGTHHPSTGLSAALNHITKHVFATKQAQLDTNQTSKAFLEEELEEVFKGRNRAHFAPADYSSWRSQVKSSTGGFSNFSGTVKETNPDTFKLPTAMEGEEAIAFLGGNRNNGAAAGGRGSNPQQMADDDGLDADEAMGGVDMMPLTTDRFATPGVAERRRNGGADDGLAAGEDAMLGEFDDYADDDADLADLDPFGDVGNASKKKMPTSMAANTDDDEVVEDFSADPLYRETSSGKKAAASGATTTITPTTHADGTPLDDDSDYYYDDFDSLKEHKLIREGGLRGLSASAAAAGAGGNGDDASSAAEGFALRFSDALLRKGLRMKLSPTDEANRQTIPDFDIDDEVDGVLLTSLDHVGATNSRLLGIQQGGAFVGGILGGGAAGAAVSASPSVVAESVSTLPKIVSTPATKKQNPPAPAGFFLKRAPKPKAKKEEMPTLAPLGVTRSEAYNNAKVTGATLDPRLQKLHRTSQEADVKAAMAYLGLGGNNSGGASVTAAAALGGGSAADHHTAIGGEGHSVPLGLLSPHRIPPTATATAVRSPNLKLSELSLVDQQLDDVVGQSGYGEVFDGYAHLPARSKFGVYRDKSMRGQHWKRSRLPGEKLRDERWK